jgi:hypothetical protein
LRKKHADQHAGAIQHCVHERERNQPAKRQVQERLEDRERHRREQPEDDVFAIERQRHHDMLE